jgi:aerobic-type carbon monoxide dehydrogenase small subunit (CoxS/CutS family)
MIVTATDYLENSPRHDREALMRAIEGNVCRCTGYVTIVAAIESAQAAIERVPAALESAQAAVEPGE